MKKTIIYMIILLIVLPLTTMAYFSAPPDQVLFVINQNKCINCSSDLAYAQYYIRNESPVILPIVTPNTYAKIVDWSEGEKYNIDFISNTSLNINYNGIYDIFWQLAFNNGINDEWETTVFINEIHMHECESSRKLGSGGDVGSYSGGCFLNLSVNDNISLRSKNLDSSSNGVIQAGQFQLIRITAPGETTTNIWQNITNNNFYNTTINNTIYINTTINETINNSYYYNTTINETINNSYYYNTTINNTIYINTTINETINNSYYYNTTINNTIYINDSYRLKTTSSDNTPNYLENKLFGTSPIFFTQSNTGGNIRMHININVSALNITSGESVSCLWLNNSDYSYINKSYPQNIWLEGNNYHNRSDDSTFYDQFRILNNGSVYTKTINNRTSNLSFKPYLEDTQDFITNTEIEKSTNAIYSNCSSNYTINVSLTTLNGWITPDTGIFAPSTGITDLTGCTAFLYDLSNNLLHKGYIYYWFDQPPFGTTFQIENVYNFVIKPAKAEIRCYQQCNLKTEKAINNHVDLIIHDADLFNIHTLLLNHSYDRVDYSQTTSTFRHFFETTPMSIFNVTQVDDRRKIDYFTWDDDANHLNPENRYSVYYDMKINGENKKMFTVNANGDLYSNGSGQIGQDFDIQNQTSFKAYKDTSQAITSTSWTKVTFTTEEWDNRNSHNTNFRPYSEGIYLISCTVIFGNMADQTLYEVGIYKNGALSEANRQRKSTQWSESATVTDIFYDDGNDYFECYAKSADASYTVGGTADYTFFSGHKLS